MTYNEINAIGTMLASLRDVHESAVTVAFTAHAGSTDTPSGSISATVSAGGFDATAEALRLADALSLARAKLRDEAKLRADDAAGKPRRGRATASLTQGDGHGG